MKNGYPNGIEIAAIVYSQILLVAIAAALAVAILAVTAAVVATAAATTSLTADDLSHLGDFLCCCLTALKNLTAEVKLQTCQWVVEVASYLLVCDILDYSIEAVTILVLQWDDSTYLYVLSVKLSIDSEDLLVEVDYALVIVQTISLLRIQLEVELFALSQINYLLLESRQGYTHTADEEERTLICRALNQHLFAVITLCYVIQCV